MWLSIFLDHERIHESGIEKNLTFYVLPTELERLKAVFEKIDSNPGDFKKRPTENYRQMLFDLVFEDWQKHKWRHGVTTRIRDELDLISSNEEDERHLLIFDTIPFLSFRKNNGKKCKLEDLGRAIDRIKKDLVNNGEVPKSELPRKHC